MLTWQRAYSAAFGPLCLAVAHCRPTGVAQMVVKLNPETLTEFDRYAKSVEAEIEQRWEGKANFISIEDSPSDKQKVMGGEFLVRPAQPTESRKRYGWPDTRLGWNRVHSGYGSGTRDRECSGISITTRRSIRKSLTRKLSATTATRRWAIGACSSGRAWFPSCWMWNSTRYYKKLAPGKWNCRAYARKITEIDKTPFSRGRIDSPKAKDMDTCGGCMPIGASRRVNGGVLAECRMLSLSRSIPQAIAWAVGPYVQKAPAGVFDFDSKTDPGRNCELRSLNAAVGGVSRTLDLIQRRVSGSLVRHGTCHVPD